MKQHTKITIAIIVFAFVLGFCVMRKYAPDRANGSFSSVTHISDFTDKRKLAGAVENIFIAKVISINGTHSPSGIPETMFNVEVSENIKGQLNGLVVVNQVGGEWQKISKNDIGLMLVDQDSLLMLQKEYLFATRFSTVGSWHTLVPKYGDLVITDESMKRQLIAEFKDAVKNQIPYDPTK